MGAGGEVIGIVLELSKIFKMLKSNLFNVNSFTFYIEARTS